MLRTGPGRSILIPDLGKLGPTPHGGPSEPLPQARTGVGLARVASPPRLRSRLLPSRPLRLRSSLRGGGWLCLLCLRGEGRCEVFVPDLGKQPRTPHPASSEPLSQALSGVGLARVKGPPRLLPRLPIALHESIQRSGPPRLLPRLLPHLPRRLLPRPVCLGSRLLPRPVRLRSRLLPHLLHLRLLFLSLRGDTWLCLLRLQDEGRRKVFVPYLGKAISAPSPPLVEPCCQCVGVVGLAGRPSAAGFFSCCFS